MQCVLAERVEGQLNEAAVRSHSQQQHCQLQLGVETQEHGAGHHGDHPAQHKELSGRSSRREGEEWEKGQNEHGLYIWIIILTSYSFRI